MCIQGHSRSDWLLIRHPRVGCLWLAHTARARVEKSMVYAVFRNWDTFDTLCTVSFAIRVLRTGGDIRHPAGTPYKSLQSLDSDNNV